MSSKDQSNDKKQSESTESGAEDGDRLTLKQLASTMLEPETLEQLRRAEQLTGIQPPPNQGNLPQPQVDPSQYNTNPQRLPGGGFPVPRQHSVLEGALSGSNPVVADPNAHGKPAADQRAQTEPTSPAPASHNPAPASHNSFPPQHNPSPLVNSPAPSAPGSAQIQNQNFAPGTWPAQPVQPAQLAQPAQSTKAYNSGAAMPNSSGRPRKGITRTAIDMIVSFGNSLTGKQSMGDSEYTKVKPTLPTESEADGSVYGQHQSSQSISDAHDQNVPHEPHERVPKTLLDVSVLDQITLTSNAKKALQAAEDAKARALEPVKQFVPVEADRRTSKCPFKWEEEDSKDKFRHCDRCQKQVYNFADMERPQAEALIFTRENITGPTLYQRPDGKFMTSDCPLATQALSKTIYVIIAALVALGCLIMLVTLSINSSKPVTSGTSEGSQATGNADQSSPPTAHKRRNRTGSSSADGSDNPNSSTGSNSNGSASGAPSTSTQQSQGALGASNGGYGPSNDSSQSTWQWEYDKSQQNSTPAPPVQSTAPTAKTKSTADDNMSDAQKAELERLRQNLRLQGTPAEGLDR
ncbi:MAG TPA: hypothetical protein V6C97_32475 [Oculatellaceae cyanobacterium]